MINGGIAIRLLADEGELAESHEFEITIGLYDEEEPLHRIGGLVAGQPGGAEVVLPGLGVPLIVHLNIAGIPLPSVGWYSVRLFVDGARLGQVPFRVVEDLSPPGPGSV